MRFFTSDTHFGHANIIKYSNRPFNDVSHMNEEIIRRWNHVVGEDDIVFHLGDVALGPWGEWEKSLSRLNGYKVLVVGNHDRIFKGEKERMQERFSTFYHQFFDEVHHNFRILLSNGHGANLSHFPYEGDSHDGDRFEEFRLEDEGMVLIHGHTHQNQIVSRTSKGTLQIHVGQDAFDYTPVSEEQIIRIIEERSQ